MKIVNFSVSDNPAGFNRFPSSSMSIKRFLNGPQVILCGRVYFEFPCAVDSFVFAMYLRYESKLFLLIKMTEQPQVTTISKKGQVVIPQSIRKELKIKPKNKFLVYGKDDTIILKKLELPDLKKEWDNIFQMMDKKELKISDKEIEKEIRQVRKKQPEE